MPLLILLPNAIVSTSCPVLDSLMRPHDFLTGFGMVKHRRVSAYVEPHKMLAMIRPCRSASCDGVLPCFQAGER